MCTVLKFYISEIIGIMMRSATPNAISTHMVAAFVCICFSVGMAQGEERLDTPSPPLQSEQLEPSRSETGRLPQTTIKVREDPSHGQYSLFGDGTV